MMRLITARIKPAHGFSQIVHVALTLALPAVLLILVRLQGGFVQLALSLVLLSKWRMFAVRPRFWPVIIRANAVDLTVGLSAVLFMASSPSGYLQLLWASLYAAWLLVVKPASGTFMVTSQAMIAQLCGLMALFLVWSDGPLFGLIFLTGIICYISARHFFDNFDEPYAKLLSYLWAYFGAALLWVLGHWLLFYGLIAQPTLILSSVGYGLAVLYYFDHKEKLSQNLKLQIILLIISALLIIIFVPRGQWDGKVL